MTQQRPPRTYHPPDDRARLLTGLGAALGIVGSMAVIMLRSAGVGTDLPVRFITAGSVPPVLAAVALALARSRPRAAGTLVVLSAGLLLGVAAAGSGIGTGLLWMPGALLLAAGAYRVVNSWRNG